RKNAVWTWRRLLRQAARRAASRDLERVGSKMAIRTAMMPMTTRSSTSVIPLERAFCNLLMCDSKPSNIPRCGIYFVLGERGGERSFWSEGRSDGEERSGEILV